MSLPDSRTEHERREKLGAPEPAATAAEVTEGQGEWRKVQKLGSSRDIDPGEGAREEEKRLDLELVARIRNGETAAFEELLERYQGRVFRLVRRMWARERQTAEDLCQEVFLRVYRGIPKFQGDCAFSTWVHRITVNVCISEMRSRATLKRNRMTLSIHAPLGGENGEDGRYIEPVAKQLEPAEEVARRELFQACRNAIDSLPSLWRVILTMRDIEGQSYEEIAAVLDLPIGTVRSRLHRARARVRDLLEKEER